MGFIWVTALVRLVIVLHRHEVFTADPIFAAMITFGVPAVLLVMAAVAVVPLARRDRPRVARGQRGGIGMIRRSGTGGRVRGWTTE